MSGYDIHPWRKVLGELFDGSNDMYLYDWYAVAAKAAKKNQWPMLDLLHQGVEVGRV